MSRRPQAFVALGPPGVFILDLAQINSRRRADKKVAPLAALELLRVNRRRIRKDNLVRLEPVTSSKLWRRVVAANIDDIIAIRENAKFYRALALGTASSPRANYWRPVGKRDSRNSPITIFDLPVDGYTFP